MCDSCSRFIIVGWAILSLTSCATQHLCRCFSSVGRRGNGQMVSLSRRGCIYLGTVQHELLHALGFNHEHCRSDRDQHIKVLLENVIPGRLKQWRGRQNKSTYDLPIFTLMLPLFNQTIVYSSTAGREYNFNKFNTLNEETPYDYDSVMHYGRSVHLWNLPAPC